MNIAREFAWSAGFLAAALVVAVLGEPRPLALVTAAAGAITGAVIAVVAIEQRVAADRRRRHRRHLSEIESPDEEPTDA